MKFTKGHPTIDPQETHSEDPHWGRNIEGRVLRPHMWCRPASRSEAVAKAPAKMDAGLSDYTGGFGSTYNNI